MMSLPTVRERILLHLLAYTYTEQAAVVPFDISQPGIAESLGLARSHVSKELIRLKDHSSHLVSEDIRHVKGSRRRRKVYFLTPQGVIKAKELRDVLMDLMITVKDEEGEHTRRLGEIDQFLDERDPVTSALKYINDELILDLCNRRDLEESFIGRKSELEFLKRQMADVKKGRARVIVIKGETGIGKTRLVMEFKPVAVDFGFRFIEGVCKVETADPYLPFKEAFSTSGDIHLWDYPLNSGLATYPGSELEDRANLDALREAVFYNSAKIIRDISEKTPLVIFLDDLHWADKASLDLFRYMAETFGDERVLLLTTYRPEEIDIDHPLLETLSRMSRKEIYTEIELEPFDIGAIKDLIDDTTGYHMPDPFAEYIHKKTGGNPLFIKQLVDAMQEERKLDPERGVYDTDDISLTIPEVVAGIVNRKLSRLEQGSRKVLDMGCILGSNFTYEDLESVSQINDMVLLDHIDILVDQGILCEDVERDRYYFTHELVREAVYDNVKILRKKKLHGIIAEMMVKKYSDSEEKLFDIAHHYMKADAHAKALNYYIKAGDRAKSVYAHEDAIALYEKGLKLVSGFEGGEKREVSLLEKIGDTYSVLGKYENGREKFRSALDTIGDDDELTTRILRKIANTWLMQGNYEKTMEYLERCFLMCTEDMVEWCVLSNLKGWTHMKTGEYGIARSIFMDELKAAEKLGDRKEISRAHHNVGTIALQRGDFDEAVEHLKNAVDGFSGLGERLKLSKSLNNLGVLYLRRHEIDTALDYHEKSLKNMNEVGDIQGIAMNLNNMGIIYTMMGDHDKALDCHDRSMDIKQKIGDLQGLAESFTNIGAVYEQMGDLKRALRDYDKGLSISREIGDKRGTAELQNDIGWIHNIQGDVIGTLEMLRESLRLRDEIGDIHGQAESHRNIGMVMLKIGKMDKAPEHLDKAFELAKEMDDLNEIATISCISGDLHRQEGNLEKALSYYEKCLSLSVNMIEKELSVTSELGMAKTYLDMGEDDIALELVERALETAVKEELKLEMAVSHKVRGKICRLRGEFKEAQNEFWKCREILSETTDREELPKVYFELARLMDDCDERDTADRYLQDALDGFSESGMVFWMEKLKNYRENKVTTQG